MTKKAKIVSFRCFKFAKISQNFFLKVIEKKYSKQFANFFNLDLIKHSLKNNNFIDKEEWFVLRLFSLLIFANKYKIKIK